MRRRPTTSRCRRLARRLGLTRNPLCRRADRLEGALLLATPVVVLLALGSGVLFGVGGYQDDVAWAEEARRGRTLVPVVLQADTPTATDARTPLGPGVRAMWTLPDGRHRTGRVYPLTAAKAGQTVEVWMDSSGWPLAPQHSRTDFVVGGVVDGAVAALVLGSVAGAVLLSIREHLDRVRIDSWNAEWSVVEPQWSNRR
ncbi:Rv1733c family protein [Cryptosporangium minutisporangium]|uniref:Pilus assembly protein n=1 Tax=Cryptosporangium minutisporangium TaxID=113569 RepID=A0ABP6T755_9ACTN